MNDTDNTHIISVSADRDKWTKLSYRQEIWKFMSKEIQGQWSRQGNVFHFQNSRDAVIFRLYWT